MLTVGCLLFLIRCSLVAIIITGHHYHSLSSLPLVSPFCHFLSPFPFVTPSPSLHFPTPSPSFAHYHKSLVPSLWAISMAETVKRASTTKHNFITTLSVCVVAFASPAHSKLKLSFGIRWHSNENSKNQEQMLSLQPSSSLYS